MKRTWLSFLRKKQHEGEDGVCFFINLKSCRTQQVQTCALGKHSQVPHYRLAWQLHGSPGWHHPVNMWEILHLGQKSVLLYQTGHSRYSEGATCVSTVDLNMLITCWEYLLFVLCRTPSWLIWNLYFCIPQTEKVVGFLLIFCCLVFVFLGFF